MKYLFSKELNYKDSKYIFFLVHLLVCLACCLQIRLSFWPEENLLKTLSLRKAFSPKNTQRERAKVSEDT